MNITSPLSAWAKQTPNDPALVTGESSLSFAELDQAVSATAASFKKAGLVPGDIVGIRLSNQVRHFVTSLALARLGAGQMAFDASDPAPLQRELAGRLKIVAIVADRAEKNETGTPRIDPPTDNASDLKRLGPVKFKSANDGALPFLALRSSGTTGVPKIGMLSHDAASARLKPHAHRLPDGPGCRFLSLIDIGFHGVKQRAFRCVASGGNVALLQDPAPESLIDFVAEHRINYLDGVPNHAAILLKFTKKNKFLFPDLKAFRVSSTVVPDILRNRILERITPNLYIGYGCNEAGAISTAPPSQVRNITRVVGNVVPGMQVEIVDDDDSVLASGYIGKVRLKSAGMISGYVDQPDQTALSFRDGWFYPGDLAEYTANGELIHHGRADDLMILDGINIYPAEIENVLLQHPDVAEAGVFSLRSLARGDTPVAAVVSKDQTAAGKLLSYCKKRLGAHAPHDLIFVPKMPKNSVGKIVKNELVIEYRRQRKMR